jgi:hypothetical protein
MLRKKLQFLGLGVSLMILAFNGYSSTAARRDLPAGHPAEVHDVSPSGGVHNVPPTITVEHVVANRPKEVDQKQCEKYFSTDFFEVMAENSRRRSFTYHSLHVSDQRVDRKRIGKVRMRLLQFKMDFLDHKNGTNGYFLLPILKTRHGIALRPAYLSTYYCDVVLKVDQGESRYGR